MGYRIVGTVPNAVSKNMKYIYLDNGKDDLSKIDVKVIEIGSEARDINTRDMWVLTPNKTWQQCPWREGIIEEAVMEDVPETADVQFVRVRDSYGTASWQPLSDFFVENPTAKGTYVREAYYATPEEEAEGKLSFKWAPAGDVESPEVGHFYVRTCKNDGTMAWTDASEDFIVPDMTLTDWSTKYAVGDQPEWAHIIDSKYDAFQIFADV